jgi:hypothetical protein
VLLVVTMVRSRRAATRSAYQTTAPP